MRSAVGYVIRFYNENNCTSFFYSKIADSAFPMLLVPSLWMAKVFSSSESATNKIVDLKAKRKANKRFDKGYFYISKVFYQMDGNGKIPSSIKLTKLDKNDFINAL